MDMMEKLTPAEKRFGMAAVEKGYITKEQLLDALKIQIDEEVERESHRPIGEILVEMNAISMDQLPPREKRFGMVAVEKGYITKEQLIDALKIQIDEDLERGSHRPIGEILVEMNAISMDQLPPREKRFGMVAIQKGYITKEQLLDALKTQIEENLEHGSHRFIGVILVGKKAIDTMQFRSIFSDLGIGAYSYL